MAAWPAGRSRSLAAPCVAPGGAAVARDQRGDLLGEIRLVEYRLTAVTPLAEPSVLLLLFYLILYLPPKSEVSTLSRHFCIIRSFIAVLRDSKEKKYETWFWLF